MTVALLNFSTKNFGFQNYISFIGTDVEKFGEFNGMNKNGGVAWPSHTDARRHKC